MATNGTSAHTADYAASSTTADAAPISSSSKDISKDEVGWYFVEQYYTTLSRHPDKLHLFYSKRSQFVSGKEAEAVNVAVGRQAIQERIKELNIDECKVRVSNVDSQSSFDNIVIQVIGETSMKGGEPKKFVQTFILAQQPSGYFVLNDIFRYIDEEAEEDGGQAATAEAPTEQAVEPERSDDAVAEQPEPAALDTAAVDEKLEEVEATEDHAAAVEAAAPEPFVEHEETVEDTQTTKADVEATTKELEEEEIKQAELPQDPTPTPAPEPAAVEPEKPKAPAKPLTWASRLAAAAGPVRPALPLPKAAPAAAAPSQPRAAVRPASSSTTKPVDPPATNATPDASNEWHTAGSDHKRQNRPQSVSGPAADGKDGTMGYVRNVTEKIQEEELRAALESAGELVYFDINRSKNCAFVEYAHAAGYQAAIAANPHTVSGESINVEPRRPKAGAYGGSNYSQGRGGMPTRGRGGFDGNRQGSQGGSRGSFNGSRGRGGVAPRGRGASQAA